MYATLLIEGYGEWVLTVGRVGGAGGDAPFATLYARGRGGRLFTAGAEVVEVVDVPEVMCRMLLCVL